MNTLLKLIFLFCFCLFFSQPAYAQEVFKCTYSPNPYPILTDKDGNITVQGKAKFCVYPKDAKMSTLFEKIKDLPEKEKVKIPEYLVAQEFLAIQQEDLPAIYKLYTGEKDLKRAKGHYDKNIKSISKFFKGYTDLEFLSKDYFGNYISITYNCINLQGKIFPSWCYVKFVNGHYYITRDIDDKTEVQFYSMVTSRHPWYYFNPAPFKASDKKFMVNLTFYAKDEEGNDIKENPVSLSYNSAPYSPGHSIFLEKNRINDKEAAFLYKVVKTFPKGSDEEILNLWHPDDHEEIAEELKTEREENMVTDIYQFRSYFEDIKDIYIVDKIFSSDGVIVYYEPVIKGKVAPLQTIIFKKSKGEYCLWSGNSMKYPKSLLQSKFMLQSIKERLNQRRANL